MHVKLISDALMTGTYYARLVGTADAIDTQALSCNEVAMALERENPEFDGQAFLTACGLTENEIRNIYE